MPTKEFITSNLPTVSAQAEAAERIYEMYQDKHDGNRIWLVACQPNAADNIYCGYPYNTNSQGFGGAWLTFKLKNGGEIKLQGPWHSNSTSLKNHTGIDLKEKHYTFGCVAKKREPSYQGIFLNDRYTELLHADDDWVLGSFDRIEDLAQKFANELKQPVYYYSRSNGGSTAGMKEPSKDES